jgi:hypothetical protein
LKLLTGAVALVCGCLVVKFVVMADHRKSAMTAKEVKAAAIEKRPAPPTPQAAKKGRVETEIITLGSTGFDPLVITRPQGTFVLLVDNRSGLSDMALTLDREAGVRLKEVSVPQEKLDWSEGLDLQPGRYVLRESSHPEWSCTITITPK